jgi:class 3 adenylate cyclase
MATEASKPRRKLSAILMVDVSGFSRMMGRDEEGTTALIREFHTRTRSLVEAHEGWVVDTAGDSVFGEFDSVVNAVRCAQAIQHTQATVNASHPPEERIETRIGVHLGDVIVQDYHVYGDGVNIAARLQTVAAPGSICVSEAVYQQVYKKLDLTFEDLGVQELKNIEHPIRLYRVVVPGRDRPASPPQGPQPDLQTPGPWPPVPSTDSWTEAFLQLGSLIPLVVGACLLASPLGLFPFSTGGVFPTAGAVLAGVGFGRVWARRTGRRGYFLIALGAAITLGAVFTRWSNATNSGFILGGLITAACGVSKLRAAQTRTTRVHARRARDQS